MSYHVTVTNQFSLPLQTGTNEFIQPAGTWTSGSLGNVNINVPGFGSIVLQDIGLNHIPGDGPSSWGVLIVFQGYAVVGRYEGGGSVQMTVTAYGQLSVSGMDIREVDLPVFILS